MKYTITRKYALPGYENFDISDLEVDDPVKALKSLDKKAEEYKKSLIKEEPFPDRVGPKPTGVKVARP